MGSFQRSRRRSGRRQGKPGGRDTGRIGAGTAGVPSGRDRRPLGRGEGCGPAPCARDRRAAASRHAGASAARCRHGRSPAPWAGRGRTGRGGPPGAVAAKIVKAAAQGQLVKLQLRIAAIQRHRAGRGDAAAGDDHRQDEGKQGRHDAAPHAGCLPWTGMARKRDLRREGQSRQRLTKWRHSDITMTLETPAAGGPLMQHSRARAAAPAAARR